MGGKYYNKKKGKGKSKSKGNIMTGINLTGLKVEKDFSIEPQLSEDLKKAIKGKVYEEE